MLKIAQRHRAAVVLSLLMAARISTPLDTLNIVLFLKEGFRIHLRVSDGKRNKVLDVNENQLLASLSQRESCCLLLLPAVCWLCHPLQLTQSNTLCFI